MISVRIVTINTAKGDFDYSPRLPWLIQSLTALEPDIVLLQESLATMDGEADSHDTARSIAAALHFGAVSAPARRKHRLVDRVMRDTTSGLAIVSRFPIEGSIVVPLPSDPADGERIALLARISIGELRLLCGNLHLTHLGGEMAGRTRREEFETLLRHSWLENDADACVIGGDCNTRLPALPSLIDNHDGWDIRDSWEVGGGTGPRSTVPVSIPPDDDRGRCVDYLLSVRAADSPHPQFADAEIVLGTASPDGRYPSDHRGIATTLILNRVTNGVQSP